MKEMKKINWIVRFKNPVFVAQLVMSIIIPIAGYVGINLADINSWQIVGELLLESVKNPYVLALVAISVFNTVNDPTTKGIKDSERALTYIQPN